MNKLESFEDVYVPWTPERLKRDAEIDNVWEMIG